MVDHRGIGVSANFVRNTFQGIENCGSGFKEQNPTIFYEEKKNKIEEKVGGELMRFRQLWFWDFLGKVLSWPSSLPQ